MALYIGRNMVKVSLNGVMRRVHLLTAKPVISTVLLRSFDGCILKDSAGVRLAAKGATNNG